MSSQPFDLNKLDHKRVQRDTRHVWLRRSIMPVALTLLVATWFLLPTLLNRPALSSYKNGHFKSARRWLTPLTWTSPQRFVIEFNSGTTDSQLARYDRAEVELNKALALAPTNMKCKAAQNLAYTYRAHAGSVTIPSQANVYLNKQKDVITAHTACFKGGAASAGGGGGASATAASTGLSDSQQQQLQQKEQDGQNREAQYARDEAFDPTKPQTKPW